MAHINQFRKTGHYLSFAFSDSRPSGCKKQTFTYFSKTISGADLNVITNSTVIASVEQASLS